MRILPLLAPLALLVPVSALQAESSVWKITRDGQVVYLAGTCHVLRASDFPLPPEFYAAYEASDTLYFETEIARMQSPEMQQVVAQHGFFRDERTLEGVLQPKTWEAVQAYAKEAGLPVEQVRRMKPWMFAVIMAAIELQKLGVSMEGVDLHYYKRARADGKTTEALETFEQQVEYLTSLGAGHEDEMLSKSMEELEEMPEQVDEMLAAWRSGDVQQLEKLLISDVQKKYPAIYQELFVQRNQEWLPKIEALFETEAVEAVFVGVAHVAGEDGLLAQLRARGYALEQISAER